MFDRKIDYFMLVVEEGSFSSAAKKCLLSQSAISQQISQLEKELNVLLFDRTGYKPVLTNQGKIFYDGCVKLKKEADDLMESLVHHKKITIGLTHIEQNKHIIQIINQFKNKYHHIDFDLVEGTFEETNTNLIQHQTDIAFGLESDFKNHADIHYTRLFAYTMCMICSLNHPLANRQEITIQELRNENFICMSKKMGRNFYKDFLNAFKLDGVKPHIVKEVDSFEELLIDVTLDRGIAICSREVVNDHIVKAIPIIHTHHHNDYVIAYHQQRSEECQKFIDETVDYFKTL